MQRRGRELSRRELLLRAGGGLGSVALALTAEAPAHAVPLRPHFPPRVKRIIHLFMNGGPFQADFFDPKP
ncbi:MAG: DUF1501 domain-containing protein, partial [Armatimonadetes bacterium]|nr:DUF1501 domain-containing protein [Armatimonadota bacterium]